MEGRSSPATRRAADAAGKTRTLSERTLMPQCVCARNRACVTDTMDFIWMKCCILMALLARQTAVANMDTPLLDTSAYGSYESDGRNLSNIASIFSPRMDFDQWKPLTGRGDPLHKDPTYDYEPPLLERVHYWLDDMRIEREHSPDKKSEVLMLGVSSRRPSLGSRMPSLVPRRHKRPPPPVKYEDFSYKVNERFPMTILVPPPPPPPPSISIPSHIARPEDIIPAHISHSLSPKPASYATQATPVQEHITSSYALQEANLIYQSSSTNINNWIIDLQNSTTPVPKTVSSDYGGWGATTLIDDNNIVSESQNIISNDYHKTSKHPYTFYRPMLSEAPPPAETTEIPFVPTAPPTSIPTATAPATDALQSINSTQATWSTDNSKNFMSKNPSLHDEPTTEKLATSFYSKLTTKPNIKLKPDTTVIDMISSMMSMPLGDGPDRPEDNLYAHASENLQVFKEHHTEDDIHIETMQTMQPPPPVQITEGITTPQHNYVSSSVSGLFKKPHTHTHDPYLHMRYTTPMPTTTSTNSPSNDESTTSIPMYLIIQGHSKVKTYSSKPDIDYGKENIISNEIPTVNKTNEVKHLHTKKEQNNREKTAKRTSKSHSNLKKLIENGLGSIEIQEADIGIKYDVSDGSDVPIEIYRKGIVENDDNAYSSSNRNKILSEKRSKRQIDLEDLIPFDEDTIEEYVYNFLDSKKNSTGITGLLAQAVTSDAAKVVDELEEEEEDSDEES